jgi:hypothetical protein
VIAKGVYATCPQTASRAGDRRGNCRTIVHLRGQTGARGIPATREVETALSRNYGGERIRLLVTGAEAAKQVGVILYATKNAAESIADAHVIAACTPADVSVVVRTTSLSSRPRFPA